MFAILAGQLEELKGKRLLHHQYSFPQISQIYFTLYSIISSTFNATKQNINQDSNRLKITNGNQACIPLNNTLNCSFSNRHHLGRPIGRTERKKVAPSSVFLSSNLHLYFIYSIISSTFNAITKQNINQDSIKNYKLLSLSLYPMNNTLNCSFSNSLLN